jgi:hypothetical protein
MAALMPVLMVAVVMDMLVGMRPRFVSVLMAIMRMIYGLMFMLMLVFILTVAAHDLKPPFNNLFTIL